MMDLFHETKTLAHIKKNPPSSQLKRTFYYANTGSFVHDIYIAQLSAVIKLLVSTYSTVSLFDISLTIANEKANNCNNQMMMMFHSRLGHNLVEQIRWAAIGCQERAKCGVLVLNIFPPP
jgi:hypothetical protein